MEVNLERQGEASWGRYSLSAKPPNSSKEASATKRANVYWRSMEFPRLMFVSDRYEDRFTKHVNFTKHV